MGKFEIYEDKASEMRFRLKASNGQVILASEGYKNLSGCENGIDSVKKNSKEDKNFERKRTKTGYKFTLKASNGQAIGESEVYTSESACENGIKSVMKNAKDSQIVKI